MHPRAAYLLLGVAGLVAALAACSSSHPHTPVGVTTTSVAPATTLPPATTAAPTSAATAPPSTVYTPTTPQPSPDSAAGALVNDWSTGNRAAASTVAAPPAVAALFAQPYPAGYIQARGCTDPSANPGTCTYANRESGGLYEIEVTHLPAGWYVSSVSVES
ncbi:MAG TPA: hypothetical protein VFH58_06375 [Acidimicrobiales bacterium]|nr:hypothetical protein [Acidimicrobiales bacterium]